MNGVATITVQGKPVRLKFGLPAVKRIFEKMADGDFIKDNIYTYTGMAHILYAGYLNSCLLKEATPAMTFEDFYTLIEDYAFDKTNEEEITAALRSFEQSRFIKSATGKTEEEIEEEEKKSQLTGTK